MITKRTITTLILLAAILPIGEMWKLWQGSDQEVNPWFWLNYPLNIQWYFKFLGHNVSNLLESLVVLRLSRMNPHIRLAARVFLVYRFIGLLLFFACFNKADSTLVFTCMGMIAAVMWWMDQYEWRLLLKHWWSQLKKWIIKLKLKIRHRFTPC